VHPRYQHAKHLDVFDRHLESVAKFVESCGKEGIQFLVVEMPPRHGKSFTLSRFFPTWFLGRNPDYRVMTVSYGQSLANKSSRQARNLIPVASYQQLFPDIQLDTQSKAVAAWNIDEYEGGMDALGVLGAATGKGAHILILDDLIQARDEAESEKIRDRTWEALNDDLLSRLEPGGAVVLNGTRWHIDDPIGRALKYFPEIYGDLMVRLRFPAIAEENDTLGREPGEALWPERYPIKVLERERARFEIQGKMYSWASLYQQDPIPHEGSLFKAEYFKPLIDQCPEILYSWRFWDLAMSAKQSADFTVGVKIGQAVDGHYYILDVARKRMDWGDVVPFLADVMLKDGPIVQQGIEQKGYMSRAVSDLNLDPRLKGYAIFGHDVDTDKRTRAAPLASKFAAGVIHVLNRHWTQAYIEELCLFRGDGNDPHDDQVDASSGAWAMTALGDAMATVADNGYMPMAGSY
jgi:predicted phage terminase large subunit-like protein